MAYTKSLLIAMCLVIGAFGASAYGQSPTQDVYGGAGGQALSVAQASTPGNAAATGAAPAQHGSTSSLAAATTASAPRVIPAAPSGQLPFTGLQILPLLLVGLGLIGFGIVLRRASKKPS